MRTDDRSDSLKDLIEPDWREREQARQTLIKRLKELIPEKGKCHNFLQECDPKNLFNDPRCDMAKGPCACGAWHKPDLSKPKE